MKKIKLTNLLISTLVVASVLALSPIGANAEWKQDNEGWWFTEGDSWATGWRLIDGKWYYFNSNGYMAHDTTIDGYKIGSDGAYKTIYYPGEDLIHMNADSYEGRGGYSYTSQDSYSRKTIKDNLNNEYNNFIELHAWTDDGKFYKDFSYSYVEFPLNKQYTKFKSSVGLTKDNQENLKSGDVKIYLDDVEVYSKNFKSGDQLSNIELDLTGKTKIKFAIENTQCFDTFKPNVEIGFFNPEFIK